MAIYPGAVRKLVPRTFKRATERNRINLHTAVTNSPSLYDMFSKGGACSHFYVREDGTVEQYIDTDRYSAADLEGNDATISIETWDGYTGRSGWQPPPWTPKQMDALVDLCAWIMRTHDIPVRLADDSKPGPSSRGLSWHRLGCDGNFPALPSLLAGRQQRGGGMRYSSAFGKVCPGDARIAQIPEIETRIRARLTNPTAPAQVPDVQEDDMPIIYRAGGERTRYGVLVQGLAAVELSTKAEYDNLRAAGVKEVWIERKTLDAIIAGNRGQYTAFGVREGK